MVSKSHYTNEQYFWDEKGQQDYISLSQADQQRLVEWIDWEGSGRVLDLGGGSGMVSRLLMAFPKTNCVCIDISLNLLTYSPVPSVQADAFNLPFSDNSFDLIVAAAFFHHIPGQEIALFTECNRVLKPGGTVAGYDPNANCLQNKIFMSNGPFRLKTFSPDERPIAPDKLLNDAYKATFRGGSYFFFTFRNAQMTIFEFVQRYVINIFSIGFFKKYLARWFFWKFVKH